MFNFEMCCMKCGSVDVSLDIQTPAPNTTLIHATCNDCKFNESLNDDTNRSADFVMPFGKYKGYTVKDIANMDMGYCRWAAKDLKVEAIKTVFQEYLDTM